MHCCLNIAALYTSLIPVQVFFQTASIACESKARVAELVDAADSKSAVRKDVLVRFQSRAPSDPCISLFYTDLQGFLLFR